MDDLFDSAHSLEQDFIEEGAKDGRREGKRVGLEEGRMLGVQKGFEIGAEVGQYAGFVRMLRALQQQQQQQQQQQPAGPSSSPPLLLPPLCSARIERNLCAMEECLLQFPLYDPLDESLHDLLEALRGKHKAISTALGVTNNSSSSSKAADAAQHLPRGSQQQQPGSLAF